MEVGRNSYLVFDIETYKNISDEKFIKKISENISAPSNYKDQAKIDAYIEEKKKERESKYALSPMTGQVIAVGFRTLDNQTEILMCKPGIKLETIAELQSILPTWFFFQSEKELLISAMKTMTQAIFNGSTLVSFNGKEFDLPFIFNRALINNISEILPDYPELIHKYRNDKHTDLISFFDRGGLNSLAYLMGIGELYDDKGDAIEKYYEKDDLTSIYEKLAKDLIKTELIYEKIKPWIPQRVSYY